MGYSFIFFISLIVSLASPINGMEKENTAKRCYSQENSTTREKAFFRRTNEEIARLTKRFENNKSTCSISTLEKLSFTLHKDLANPSKIESTGLKLNCARKKLNCVTTSPAPFFPFKKRNFGVLIVSINFSYNSIHLLPLYIILNNCPNLRELNASHNKIKNVEIIDYSDKKFLPSNETLTLIDLSYNRIKNYRVCTDLITSCHALTKFNGRKNPISVPLLKGYLDHYFNGIKAKEQHSMVGKTMHLTYKDIISVGAHHDYPPTFHELTVLVTQPIGTGNAKRKQQ